MLSRSNDLNDRASLGSNARAHVVNRVHRVVREEARQIHQQREQSRSLWAPIAICSALLLFAFYAAWTLLSWYRSEPGGIRNAVPDASDQLVLMLLWCLPLTAIVLGVVLYRRYRSATEI